jgi:hypothetical protein
LVVEQVLPQQPMWVAAEVVRQDSRVSELLERLVPQPYHLVLVVKLTEVLVVQAGLPQAQLIMLVTQVYPIH